MSIESAAQRLGMKVSEVVSVDGDEVTTFDGVTYLVTDDSVTVKPVAPVEDLEAEAEPVEEEAVEPEVVEAEAEAEPTPKPARGRGKKADPDAD